MGSRLKTVINYKAVLKTVVMFTIVLIYPINFGGLYIRKTFKKL